MFNEYKIVKIEPYAFYEDQLFNQLVTVEREDLCLVIEDNEILISANDINQLLELEIKCVVSKSKSLELPSGKVINNGVSYKGYSFKADNISHYSQGEEVKIITFLLSRLRRI